jgi:hypothetical protein
MIDVIFAAPPPGAGYLINAETSTIAHAAT